MTGRVLILTASAGSGHNSAAAALDIQAKAMGHESRVVDLMEISPPAFRGWFQGGYESLVRRAPRLWGWLYWASDRKGLCYLFQTWLDRRFCTSLGPVLDAYAPNWVLCTHSLPQPILPHLQASRAFRTAVVVTDCYPHRMWLRGAPDVYFVPNEHAAQVLRRRMAGLPAAVHVTGIPVHPAFSRPLARRGAHALIAAGGIGAGPLQEVAEAALSAGFTCAIVTGGNRQALSALQDKFGGDARVEVHGRLNPEEMAARLAESTVMISKAGGATTFECLAAGCPLIVYAPLAIPGQEADNARWLVQLGAGALARDPAELVRRLTDRGGLATMGAQAKAHGRPDAGAAILATLFPNAADGEDVRQAPPSRDCESPSDYRRAAK